MTKKSFAQQVAEMVENQKKVLEGVVKDAIQDTVHDAQLQGPSVANPSGGKGGSMPVDSGYLRASGGASLSGYPSGGAAKVAGVTYNYNENDINVVISQLKLGDSFFFGWTAEYALVQNYRYGFRDKAVQNFSDHAMKRAAEAKQRMNKS